MAIAIRPIPVLTGDTAERFEELVENGKQAAKTVIPESLRQSMRSMRERSMSVVIKMPVNPEEDETIHTRHMFLDLLHTEILPMPEL